jgi:hypothetical protein
VNISFSCPECEHPARVAANGPAEWRCPRCDHILKLPPPDPALTCCVVCGNHELYKKKDFPHALGMAILVGACLASTVSYWLYDKWITWAILVGSAAFDGVLYLLVKDAIVCYRCDAHYRGVKATNEHKPFELTIHERYRQERIRREQLQPPR